MSSTINDNAIRSLYVDHGRSIDQIATQIGFKPVYVRVRLVIMGLIPKRREETATDKPVGYLMTDAAIASLYAGRSYRQGVSI